MGKRSTTITERSVEEDALEFEELVEYHDIEEVATERVQLLYPAKVSRIGQVTGKQYTWNKSGEILDVFKEDVPALLNSRIGSTGCCGSSGRNGNPLFPVV